jgi:branched-chain amino acid transport system substrate-binding protein
MFSYPEAWIAAKRYPNVTTWNVIGPDNAVGHEAWDLFQSNMKARGITVKGHNVVFHPLVVKDFTPYITAVLKDVPMSSNEGLLVATYASLTIALAQQGAPFSLFQHFAAAINFGDFTSVATTLKSNVPKMWSVYCTWLGAWNTPVAKDYDALFKARFPNDLPEDYAATAFTAVVAFKAAAEKAKSTDASKLRQALVGLKFKSIQGDVTIASNHQASAQMLARFFESDPSGPTGYKVSEVLPAPSSAASEKGQ